MELDLFFSGAPVDNEWYPKNDALNYCTKYFNYTESNYSVDYEVEVLPDKACAYYTYLKHKGISGFNREGSYFAMTLKITGGFCADIIGVYHLLDTAYRNCVAAKIISSTGTGEKYIVNSLSAVDEIRTDAEKKVVQGFSLMLNKLVQYDKTFSSIRQKTQLGIISVGDCKNEQLLQELKKTHKLHLIPEADMCLLVSNSTIEKIKEYEAKLKTKDVEVSAAKEALRNAETALQKAEKKHKDLLVELSKDPTEQRWQTIAKDIDYIKGHISTLQPNKDNRGNSVKQKAESRTVFEGQINDYSGIKRLLPWLLFGLVSVILIIIAFRNPREGSDVIQLKQQISQLEQEKKGLQTQIQRFGQEKDSIKEKLDYANTILEGIGGAVGGQKIKDNSKTIPETPVVEPSYLDVESLTNGKVHLGNHKIVVKSKGGKRSYPDIEWSITKGGEYASKNGNVLECNKVGTVQITAKYTKKDGRQITRDIQITE